MSTIIDQYGRTIEVQTDVEYQVEGRSVIEDVYTFEGNGVWFPAGTPQNVALQTIEAMAPAWWTPPEPEHPIEEQQV
jgi:hypothetical protein